MDCSFLPLQLFIFEGSISYPSPRDIYQNRQIYPQTKYASQRKSSQKYFSPTTAKFNMIGKEFGINEWIGQSYWEPTSGIKAVIHP